MTIVNNTAYFKVARVLKVLISRKKKSSDRDIQAFLLKYFLHKVLRASEWAPRASAILNIYVLIYECPSFQLHLTRYVCFAN